MSNYRPERFVFDVLLQDGRKEPVVLPLCPDRNTGTVIWNAITDDLVRKGERTPMCAFTFTNVLL